MATACKVLYVRVGVAMQTAVVAAAKKAGVSLNEYVVAALQRDLGLAPADTTEKSQKDDGESGEGTSDAGRVKTAATTSKAVPRA